VVARVAHECAQQLVLGQPHVLERVCRQEAVLDHEERRLGRLSHAAGDDRQVGGLLRVAGEQDPPARVGDGHHVVVAGVDVERLARQCSGAHVEDDGEPLAADDVQDLLHQNEALAGREVRDAPTGERGALGGRRRAVLRFRFDEP
jgi:hypothetical protein